MSRARARQPEPREDVTEELTGADGHRDEAAHGDAGNGADPFGADLVGSRAHPPDEEPGEDIEDDPSHPEDIVPDQIQRFAAAPEPPEDEELTARPHRMPLDPAAPGRS